MTRSGGSTHAATGDSWPDLSLAYRRSVQEVITTLNSDERFGLTDAEARARLERVGRNELVSEHAPPAWRRFARQFQGAPAVPGRLHALSTTSIRDPPAERRRLAVLHRRRKLSSLAERNHQADRSNRGSDKDNDLLSATFHCEMLFQGESRESAAESALLRFL
jgi:hypothetical protein